MEAAVRGYEHIVAEGHLSGVQDHQIMIAVEVLADLDIVAVIAPEGWFDQEVFPCLS